MPYLQDLPRLQLLDILKCAFTDRQLSALERVRQLTYLSLTNCELESFDGMRYLTRLQQLSLSEIESASEENQRPASMVSIGQLVELTRRASLTLVVGLRAPPHTCLLRVLGHNGGAV